MSINVNSTYAELPFLDRVAVAATHVIYSTPLSSEYTSFAVLIALATSIVFLGAYSTVEQPKLAIDANEDRESPLWDQSDRDGCSLLLSSPEDAKLPNQSMINFKMAALFPVAASGALYGLAYLIRKFDISKIMLLNYYIVFVLFFSGVGAFSYLSTALARNVAYKLGLEGNLAKLIKRYRLTLSEERRLPLGFYERFSKKAMDMTREELEKFEEFMWEKNRASLMRLPKLSTADQCSAIVFDNRWPYVVFSSLVLTVIYYLYNPQLQGGYDLPAVNWLVNNAVASVLALNGLYFLKVGSFKVAAVMLVGLFVYDIYFVFKSTLMISVATNIDLPAKLVFPHVPKALVSYSDMATMLYKDLVPQNSLLGLGDIVVPGAFASLCLRFDYNLYYSRNNVAFHRLRSIGWPTYFTVAIVSYVGSLVLTMVICQIFNHGQPALLYIVPAMLGSVAITAYLNGQFRQLWEYNEELEVYDRKKENKDEEEHVVEDVEKEEEKEGIRFLGDGPVYEFRDISDESDDTYILNESTDTDEYSDESADEDDEPISELKTSDF